MALTAADVRFHLSDPSASAGWAQGQGDPNASLGRYVSVTAVPAGLNNLFDDVAGVENAARTVEYRCVFVLNNHATDTLYGAVVYLTGAVASGAEVDIAVDILGPSAKASGSQQASYTATEPATPVGTGVFSAPVTASAGLPLGDLGPGMVKAVWVRRTAADTAPLTGDGVSLAVTGDVTV